MPRPCRPASRWSPSAATSSRATPRPPTRSKPSWPTPWRPAAAASVAGALVPWICDALLSNHSVKAYGRDFMDFVRHMQAQGVTPLEVTADHVKLYKRALLEAGMTSATVARRLSVLRGAYEQLAAKGLVSWEIAQDIAAVKAPGVQKNATPSLTQRQAIALLEAIPTDTLAGHPRPGADERVLPDRLPGLGGHRRLRRPPGDRRRRSLPPRHREAEQEAAENPARRRPAGPGLRRREPASRMTGKARSSGPMTPDGSGLVRRHLDRKTPWRLVKKYCEAAGIDPSRLGSRGIGIHRLRKTAINDAIRNGATMHEVREFAGHADIRTTEVYFVRKEEDAEVAARKIQIRLTGRKGE